MAFCTHCGASADGAFCSQCGRALAQANGPASSAMHARPDTSPERRKTSKEDSCIDCHMPRFSASDIPHTASTNHQVIRDPKELSAKSPHAPNPFQLRRMPIRLFQKKDPETYTPVEKRDEVLALGYMLSKGPQFAREFLTMVEQTIAEDPTDFELWETKGLALTMLHRHSESLAAFQSGLSYAPNRETMVMGAATAAQNSNRLDDALRYWQKAAEINPANVDFHRNITLLAAMKGDWPTVKQHCEISLELDPANIDIRKTWVEFWLRQGDRERAKSEFAKIEALQPKNIGELKTWFQREMR